jgi:CubicO group peptidase (beta-lactamase class C family)
MRRLPIVIALLVSASLLAAQTAVDPRLDSALKELDTALAADFAKDGVGGLSIGVVAGKSLVWSRHYGFAEAETRRPPTNDTAYRIGSITKQFTALALLQLVEQGKMRLTDPLEKYVPEIRQVKDVPSSTPPITLLQVSTMHSGLAREPGCANNSVGPVSGWQKKVLDCLPDTAYANEPGTTYLYSNIGYASLGLAVERAGGRPFIELVTEGILKPLGMTRSAMEPTATIRENLAHGYQRRQSEVSRA